MKRSLLISESEKERILLLYEGPTSLPPSSQFVRDMAGTFGIAENVMIALDWSIYKTGGKQPNQETLNLLSQKFATLKPQINNSIGTIKATTTPTTDQTTTQQPSQYKLNPNFGKVDQTAVQPNRPTLARYTDI